MGLYNDRVYPRREEWLYEFTGKELLPRVDVKLRAWADKEDTARRTLAQLLEDKQVSVKDERLEKLRLEVQHSGTEREKCRVWCMECNRNPNRKFKLGLGDITYFDIQEEL